MEDERWKLHQLKNPASTRAVSDEKCVRLSSELNYDMAFSVLEPISYLVPDGTGRSTRVVFYQYSVPTGRGVRVELSQVTYWERTRFHFYMYHNVSHGFKIRIESTLLVSLGTLHGY